MAHKLTDEEYRNLRVHTLNQCEQMLKRPLLPFEREILLFPRMCCSPSCREWRQNLLTECKDCRQISFCTEHPEHMLPSHSKWCRSFYLFQKLILRQKILGRIEPVLPIRIAGKSFVLPPNIDEVIKLLYKNSNGELEYYTQLKHSIRLSQYIQHSVTNVSMQRWHKSPQHR